MPELGRDEVTLHYDDTGSGAPPLLFVHGWACESSHFAAQVKHFSPRHRTVTVDLRGHGRSDSPRQDYTIAGFADDVAWMCRELGLEHPVVVGHSMGGMVAVELAATLPDLASAVIAVDSGLVLNSAPAMKMRAIDAKALESTSDYDSEVRKLIDSMFIDADNPENRRRISEGMAAVPRHVAASAMRSISEWDATSALTACRFPLMHITTRRPPDPAITELVPGIMQGMTVGSGHFAQVEVPDQVNAMIDRFLEIVV